MSPRGVDSLASSLVAREGRQIVHITAISSARVLVLAEIYTEHKLVVTRLNGFMAVESPENRQK